MNRSQTISLADARRQARALLKAFVQKAHGRFTADRLDEVGKLFVDLFESVSLPSDEVGQLITRIDTRKPGADVQFKVVNLPIEEVHVDRRRFQPRRSAFAEATARRIAEHFDPQLFEPIVVWRDEQDGRTYVLAGHSRLEGMRRRGAKTIPARFFQGSEEEAVVFAQTENEKGTSLSNAERSAILRTMREKGSTEKNILEKARELFDRNASTVYALSFLEPKGRALSTLAQFEANATGEARDAETMAVWIGKIRKRHPELRARHENEMFEFLLNNFKTKGRKFSSFDGWQQFVDNVIAQRSFLGSFDAGKPLNFAEIVSRSRQQLLNEERVREAEKALREAKALLDRKRIEMAKRLQEEDVTQKDVDRVLKPFNDGVIAAQRELLRVKHEAGRAERQLKRSELNLFERNNPTRYDLVMLGYVKRLTGRSEYWEYEQEGNWLLIASLDKKSRLYVVPIYRTRKIEMKPVVEGEKAKRLFEKWHGFEVDDTAFEIRWPAAQAMEEIGAAVEIVYISDKLVQEGDRKNDFHTYRHEFDPGKRTLLKWDDIAVIDGVKITKAGIMN